MNAVVEEARPMTQPDVRALRNALGVYPTGVTIVTTRGVDGRSVGLTVNSFASLSLEPPLLLWSLSNRSPNLRAFRTASHFVVNVLAQEQEDLAMRFASPSIVDKFEGVALRDDPLGHAHGVPLVDGAAAWFVCACRDAIETGDHTLFIGRVVAHESATEQSPLVFQGGRFAALR